MKKTLLILPVLLISLCALAATDPQAREWIKTGAQPTETVRALLKKVDVQ